LRAPTTPDGSVRQTAYEDDGTSQWKARERNASARTSGATGAGQWSPQSDSAPARPPVNRMPEDSYEMRDQSVLEDPADFGDGVGILNAPVLDSSALGSPRGNRPRSGLRRPLEERPLTNASLRQDMPQRQPLKSCEDYRNELLNKKITDIYLNYSPRRPEGAADLSTFEPRTWYDQYGTVVGDGRLVDLRRGMVIIESANGERRLFPMSRLSDGDLAAVAAAWGLPVDCSLGLSTYQPRCWCPQTVTWHASALCHKTLYFQDEYLERYGHTYGPFLEPIHSTAHFFISVAALPYHMGIHPPNECNYALGYYRPGNCAPWLYDPVPLSLRGAYKAGMFFTGAAAVLR